MSLGPVPLASRCPLAGKVMLGVPAKQVQPQNTHLKDYLIFLLSFLLRLF